MTLIVDWPTTAANVAVIEVVPNDDPVARPVELIVTIEGFAAAHVTCDVRFCIEPSEKVPMAVNWTVVKPSARIGFAGVTAIDSTIGALTVRMSAGGAVNLPNETVIEVVPSARLVASPVLEEMVATLGFDEAHAT